MGPALKGIDSHDVDKETPLPHLQVSMPMEHIVITSLSEHEPAGTAHKWLVNHAANAPEATGIVDWPVIHADETLDTSMSYSRGTGSVNLHPLGVMWLQEAYNLISLQSHARHTR